jgi:protein SCO1/2
MFEVIASGPAEAVPRSVIRRARFAPPPSKREIVRQKSFPDVTLVTHRGKTVRFYDDLLKNKIVVLSVMSAQRAERCATVMSHLAQVQKLLRGWFAEDVHFYSITATPEHDTPETLQAFADAHGVRGKWRLLTGAPADVDYLRGVLGWTKDGERLTDFIRYGNEPRALWGACEATVSPQRMAEDVSFVIRRPILL